MKRTFVCALALSIATAAACSPSDSAPASPASDAGSGRQPSPPTLRQFESDAEAMSENALPTRGAPAWTVCQGTYDQATSLWQTLKPLVLAAGSDAKTTNAVAAIDAALSAYGADIAAQKPRNAATDANEITLAVPDLFDLFDYPAPTDTLRLDGTFRQLQIDAQFSDWAACAKDLADTSALWARFKPLAEAQAPQRPDVTGAPTLITDVETVLAASQGLIGDGGGAASNSPNLVTEAQAGLDLVDVGEQIFSKASGSCADPHFTRDPADGKCKLDGTTTNVGAPCQGTTPAVCGTDQKASCLDEVIDEFPGGYCNVDPCTVQALCPVGSSCVELNGENGQCFKNCVSDADCRTGEGYFCLDATADDRLGGHWLSGASHKVCSRALVTCPLSAGDCPAVLPKCVLPNGQPAYDADGGMVPFVTDAGADAAPTAPPTPVCTK
jgi:hypothetical protein